MDPLSITSTVISISAHCVKSARALYDLRTKYKDASMTITAIYSESTVISTSLAHIQGLISKDPDALRSTLQERPELEGTFDTALTGCVLVYSVIDDEVQRLYTGIRQEGFAGMMGKVKFLWKEEAMKDVLQQIRGQQTALGLLIQALQMSSIHDIRKLLQNNNAVLQNVAQRTTHFREANPRVRAPTSVFEMGTDDVASLYSVDSAATSTNFVFDDQIVNAQAYRRLVHHSRSNLDLEALHEQSETSDADTVIGHSSAAGAEIPPKMRALLSPVELSAMLNELEAVAKQQVDRDTAAKLEEGAKNFAELRTKYVNVKRCYFDKVTEIEAQKKDHDMLMAEYSRVVAEKAEITATNSFLQEQAERHTKWFEENESKRKLVTEGHEKQVRVMNDKIAQLEKWFDDEKKTNGDLRKSNTTKVKIAEEMTQLAESKDRLLQQVNARADQYGRLLAEMKAQRDAKVEEIERYKGYDAIIEQLRLLSPGGQPTSPGSPGGNPNRSSSAENRLRNLFRG